MVHGANRSGSRKKVFVKTPSGTKARYLERKPGKARCISGRILAGTASGTKSQVGKLSKTQRRPSRPFGGVLSAPVTHELFRAEAAAQNAQTEPVTTTGVYGVGRVCMKVAGRDAGALCVIVDEKDGRVLVDGQTRRRLVNPHHIEPLNQVAEVAKGASHEDVVKALEKIEVQVKEHRVRSKKQAKK